MPQCESKCTRRELKLAGGNSGGLLCVLCFDLVRCCPEQSELHGAQQWVLLGNGVALGLADRKDVLCDHSVQLPDRNNCTTADVGVVLVASPENRPLLESLVVRKPGEYLWNDVPTPGIKLLPKPLLAFLPRVGID